MEDENAGLLAERNLQLQLLVAELLKKNEGLRQQLLRLEDQAGAAGSGPVPGEVRPGIALKVHVPPLAWSRQ